MILSWGRVVNGIKNGADGSDNVVLVETSEAIDPWLDIDFNWRLEAQRCVDKAKATISIRSRTVLWPLKHDRGPRPRDVIKKNTEKVSYHVAVSCEWKTLHQASCFSKTIVMNMMPPDYPGIYIGTDISNSIFVQIGGTLQNFVC